MIVYFQADTTMHRVYVWPDLKSTRHAIGSLGDSLKKGASSEGEVILYSGDRDTKVSCI
jgi:hypothetical protein